MDNLKKTKEAERAERGVKFSQWLREVTRNPTTNKDATASEVSQATGISYNRVNRMLNHDCEEEGRVSLPRAETIDAIAHAYKVDGNKGKVIVGLLPTDVAQNIFVPEPGSVMYKTSTGYVIFAPPNDPDAKRRVALIDAYLLGLADGREQRD